MIVTDTQTPLSGVAITLGKNLMATLCRHYPQVSGGWHVTINTDGGVVMVRNTILSGKMGFTVPISELDPEGRHIMRLGGELLERYRIERDKALDVRQMLAGAERHRSGEMVADV